MKESWGETAYRFLHYAAKTVLRGKFIAHIKEKEMLTSYTVKN